MASCRIYGKKKKAIRMSEDFWDRVHRFCSEGCMWVKPLVFLTPLRGPGIISLIS